MRWLGRRNGFMGGTVATAIGGVVATLALFESNFWLFAFGLLIVGAGNSFVQQYRFAAADNAPSEFKANAISWVLAGGVFAAIIGPQAVIWNTRISSRRSCSRAPSRPSLYWRLSVFFCPVPPPSCVCRMPRRWPRAAPPPQPPPRTQADRFPARFIARMSCGGRPPMR